MFEMSPRASSLKTRLEAFMDAEIYPNEAPGLPMATQPIAVA
jgi:hypothetical protein